MESLFRHNLGLFVIFNIVVIGMLAVDLGLFNRKAREIGMREAVAWTGLWILLAIGFAVVILVQHGQQDALLYLTAYLIEKSLSVDNIFVFIVIFRYFAVPHNLQHKVLFWGIVGALVMRAVLIAAGIALIEAWSWLIYVLGAFLIVTGIKAAISQDKEIDISRNPVLKFLKRFLNVSTHYHGSKFIVREHGKYLATPLLIVLIVVEATDLIFALDSIPAILAVSTDPFIVYTSNVFAILGLRALYFVVADMVELFRYLRYGVCAVLVFVGIKMLISDFYHFPPTIALSVVGTLLSGSVVLSLMEARQRRARR